MKKWFIIAGLLLIVSALGIAAYIGIFGNDAPATMTYYGKPLAYWFKPWRTPAQLTQVSVDAALPEPGRGDFNPEAIPFLVKKLNYRQTFYTRAWSWVWRKLPIPRTRCASWVQPMPEDTMRLNARNLLRLSKYNANACVPVLIKEFQKSDSFVKVVVAGVLGEIGAPATEALPLLRTSLLSQDGGERRAAETAIAQILGATAK